VVLKAAGLRTLLVRLLRWFVGSRRSREGLVPAVALEGLRSLRDFVILGGPVLGRELEVAPRNRTTKWS